MLPVKLNLDPKINRAYSTKVKTPAKTYAIKMDIQVIFIDITNTQTALKSLECDFVCVCSSPKA
jgi:hypothetical protein